MKTNEEWLLWGERDPLWGVASWPGRDKQNTPWTDAEFYALGADWSDFHVHWSQYGLDPVDVLEIGCGAGRITNRLTENFSRVIATDVSDGMLRYARERVLSPIIDWRISDGNRLPASDLAVTAIFSCHVLQHFESTSAQISCFAEMHRVLKSGGTIFVHIPIHQFADWNPAFARIARFGYRAFLALSSLKATIRRAMMRVGGRLYMHGVSIEQRELYTALQRIGFERIEMLTFPIGSNGNLHTCVLATKR